MEQKQATGKTKLFGIGLQRTGTTSLHHALLALGWRSAPDSIALFYDISAPLRNEYDAFFDNPIPLLYPKLDKLCPDSKFILTTRPLSDWLRSAEWLYKVGIPQLSPELQRAAAEIHTAFYGIAHFDSAHFEAFWQSYHTDVRHYFKNREADLLTINITDDLGWQPLCSFLGVDIPAIPFPNRNAAAPPSLRTRLKTIFRGKK